MKNLCCENDHQNKQTNILNNTKLEPSHNSMIQIIFQGKEGNKLAPLAFFNLSSLMLWEINRDQEGLFSVIIHESKAFQRS